MNQKSTTARLFSIAILTFFCLTLAVTIGHAQPGERLSAAAKADFQKGDYNSCISEYTALIAAAPKNDGFYAERSRCHYLKGSSLKNAEADAEINLALADAEKAFALNPKNTVALNIRGIVKSYKKDEKAAIDDFSKVIEIDPKYYKAYMNRAFGRDRLKDYEGAIADYTKFIELSTPTSSVYKDRGNAYFNLGKDAEAIADYDKAIGIGSKDASIYVNRGRSESALDKNIEALADFNRAIELSPKYADAFFYRGKTYAKINKCVESIADYTKYNELDPKSSPGYFNRGNCNSKLGKTAEAIADFTKAIELDPNNKSAAEHLAKVKAGLQANAVTTTSTNCISGNCVNDFGKYVFPNGDIYEGNFVNEKKRRTRNLYS